MKHVVQVLTAVTLFTGTVAAFAAPSASDWRLIGLTPEQQHFSPLNQITAQNVKKLGLGWAVEIPSKDGLVGVPLIADGVIYQSASGARVYANDVKTGQLLWQYDPKLVAKPGQVVPSWGNLVNRGLALWEDLLFVGTGDCRLLAIDRQKGTLVWQVQACDSKQSYAITGAPRVGGGKVFIGNASADTGANRGYVEAYDARSGKRLWRFYTIPGDPAKGFESEALARAAKTWGKDYWKIVGGGSVWDAITYDPILNQVYFGTDGAIPGDPNNRGEGSGDELFTCSSSQTAARTAPRST